MKERSDEKIEFYSGANCLCFETGGFRNPCCGDCPETGDQRTDLLPLEEEVWRPYAKRSKAPATA